MSKATDYIKGVQSDTATDKIVVFLALYGWKPAMIVDATGLSKQGVYDILHRNSETAKQYKRIVEED